MKLFHCLKCNQVLYFENDRCECCGSQLGFLASDLQLYPLIQTGDNCFQLYGGNKDEEYRYCKNHDYNVCNWIIQSNKPNTFCLACQLNRIIPDLSFPEYRKRWQKIEEAKHRLVYTILRLKLPLINKQQNDSIGLSFNFMADENISGRDRVFTGHSNGSITLNIAEADDVEREQARQSMDEVYRTLLGHFRHEVGHYYWDRLIDNSSHLDAFRELFGDERQDYLEALKKHYSSGPTAGWRQRYISAYATAHPWEDWAETWAHYFHIIDTLETAHSFNISVEPFGDAGLSTTINTEPYEQHDFEIIIKEWLPLTFAMNSLNRGMGLNDLYPFIITTSVKQKLAFIHSICLNDKEINFVNSDNATIMA